MKKIIYIGIGLILATTFHAVNTQAAPTSTIVQNLTLTASSTFQKYLTCTLKTDGSGLIVCGVDNTGSGGGLASSSPFTEGLVPVVLNGNTLIGYTQISYNSSTQTLTLPTTTITGILNAALDHLASGTQRVNLGTTSTKPWVWSNNGDIYISATSTPPGGTMTDPVTGESQGTGCFRIHEGALFGNIAGSIHLGSECTQGWPDSYIDVNDVNASSSNERRLMQFWYTNSGSGGGIGASIRINTRSVGSMTLNPNLLTNLLTAGIGGTVRNIRIDNTLTLSTSGIKLTDFRILDLNTTMGLTQVGTSSVQQVNGVFMQLTSKTTMVSSTAGIAFSRPSLGTQASMNTIGLYFPRFGNNVGLRKWGVLSGERIGVSSGTAIAFDEQDVQNANHSLVTAYGDTTLTYWNDIMGLDLTVDSVSSTLWTSSTITFKLPVLASSTLTVQSSSTFRNHIDFQQTTLPTLSSCGSNPIIASSSSDNAGKFYVGTGVVSSCVLTFATSFTTSTPCVASDESQILLVRAVGATSSVTFDVATTFGGDKVAYLCFGTKQ